MDSVARQRTDYLSIGLQMLNSTVIYVCDRLKIKIRFKPECSMYTTITMLRHALLYISTCNIYHSHHFFKSQRAQCGLRQL